MLPEMTSLETLNLGHWDCKKYMLLSDHGHLEGADLKHLPRLKHVQVSNVSSKFFQNLCTFCPQIETLRVFDSDITDTVTSWVQNCKKLQMAELLEDRGVTPVGYAQLLRANPHLKSLGKCQCFGRVLSTLYSSTSAYRRNVTPHSIPEHLDLLCVDTDGKISPLELKYLVQCCPNINRVQLKYLPDDFELQQVNDHLDHRDDDEAMEKSDEDGFAHLAELSDLENLSDIRLTSADFYGHQLFRLLEVRGDQFCTIHLDSLDEVNLNAIILLGDQCPNLKDLHLIRCYFQMQSEDHVVVDRLIRDRRVAAQNKAIADGKRLGKACITTKRVRSSSSFCLDTSSTAEMPLPFTKLQSLAVFLNTPTHLPILQYVLSFARALQVLSLDQFYTDYAETFVSKTLFEWNPLVDLTEFHIGKSDNLSLVAANVIIEKCPNLKRLGKLSSWLKVTKEEFLSIQKEINLRNYDLILDDIYV